ncbi:MAG: dimethyl sulfoxide reductase anchor subunit [Pirellulales bacterium]|nr:dimethyl sulfoxide reductase anchor subunit [Pirellulales bacterium]
MSSLPIISLDSMCAAGLERTCCAPQPVPASESLLDQLLREQQELTAVERFAQHHAASSAPAAEKYYRSLMPAAPPGPGQQYAFEVDLDRCSGCQACVTACHTRNGLDPGETWRDVGLLVGGTRTASALQHVTTACHHCLAPACLNACPVNAYEKDAATGIVRHLDDQCFGCQYCTLACPYDVPKYHAGKGIVRKCDMCANRLAVGEAPACVQACPHEAISIRVIDVATAREDAEAAIFLPAAPDPRITFPTTTYKTKRSFPRNMLPVDYFEVSPQHPHLPLVVMLVLTQLSVGAFAAGLVVERMIEPALANEMRPLHGTMALMFGLVALAASTFHLGRPRYAYRALLGLRHSWMSREILAFGLFAALACAYAGLALFPEREAIFHPGLLDLLAVAVVGSGGVAIFTSVMIYATLGREYWSFSRTGIRFLFTAALLGTATVWLSVAILAIVRPSAENARLVTWCGETCCPALILFAGGKLLWELSLARHMFAPAMTPLKRSTYLMTGPLANVTTMRLASGLLGGIVMPILLLERVDRADAPHDPATIAIFTALLFAACLAGELCERYLFFAAVATPRMPGRIR